MTGKNLKTFIASTLAFFLIIISANGEEWVQFEGRTATAGKLQLTGILSVPDGRGPFPAVVMLCGCGGLRDENDAKHQKTWADRLLGWGYVSLRVDSFGPRGYNGICENTGIVSNILRMYDAFSAKAYLSKLKYVDPQKIAVIGWSHGGWAVMAIVDGMYRDEDTNPFQAAIAFYPYCQSLEIFDTPLLILIGEKDDWCPADRCIKTKEYLEAESTDYEFKLILYSNTFHSFDFGIIEDFEGHHIEPNPEATADAVIQTRSFLSKYLETRQ